MLVVAKVNGLGSVPIGDRGSEIGPFGRSIVGRGDSVQLSFDPARGSIHGGVVVIGHRLWFLPEHRSVESGIDGSDRFGCETSEDDTGG